MFVVRIGANMERFRADSRWIHDFGDIFMVECPACDGCAVVRGPGEGQAARMSCTNCGRSDEVEPARGIEYVGDSAQPEARGTVTIGGAYDWYFHLPLWLRTACGGNELWAYNEAHLRFLRDFVVAKLRDTHRDEELGYSNKSLASRLPKWLKLAKNREVAETALVRLEEKLSRGKRKSR